MKIDLSGRMAVVTGSTAGIGRATAEGLARAGASVIGNGRTQARVDRAVQQMRAAFRECAIFGIPADLSTAEGANAFIAHLAGDDITAADIVALPNIQMLRRIAVRPEAIEIELGLKDLGARLPALSAWLSRMETMRGYDAAYPPHRRS